MLRWAPCCWVHLAGVSGREKVYLGSSTLIKIYPALSAAIRGRDGVDCGRLIWMTRATPSFLGNLTNFGAWVVSSLLGAFGGGLAGVKKLIRVYCTNKNISRPFCSHSGVVWDG